MNDAPHYALVYVLLGLLVWMLLAVGLWVVLP